MNKFLAAAAALAMTVAAALPALANSSQNPTWSVPFSPSGRFVVQPFGDAVLDNETGLVWQRTPTTSTNNFHNNWVPQSEFCHSLVADHRSGWRLPTVEELSSLLTEDASDPALPSGNPFVGIGDSDQFWASTRFEGDTTEYYVVAVDTAGHVFGNDPTSNFERVWCVRTGSQLVLPNPECAC